MEQILQEMRHRLQLSAGELEGRSPLKQLESGWAFMSDQDGKRILGVEGLSAGDRIRASLRDGSFDAVVEEVFCGTLPEEKEER